jgi:hypothetical protein
MLGRMEGRLRICAAILNFVFEAGKSLPHKAPNLTY